MSDSAQAATFTYTGGPVAASPRTLAGLGRPIAFEYDPAYLQRFKAVERRVAEVFETERDVILMQGEAVLGLEAAARGLCRPGMTALNLVSGIFGKWFGDWLRALGADVVEIEVEWNEAIDPEDVERALSERPETELVAVVHSETPSGTLNPIAEIGPIARRAGALVIVDAVSAFAGTPVSTDAWDLDITVAGPQKCLGGPPGLSLVSVSDRAWEAMEANPAAPRSSYLSLLDWKQRWIDGGRRKFPYTTSVADINGVDAALAELLDEGLQASFDRHDRAARACRAGVRAMGLELWAAREEIASHCITAVTVPEGVSNQDVIAHVRSAYEVMLSDGEHAQMTDRVFRLGHMGPASRSLNPVVALSALGKGLSDFGIAVEVGAGVEAALEVLEEPVETRAAEAPAP
ncbi:MAG: pyridoxal-phosphate-dependent aminotransferase family protein [Solirubrobacterales bacterium]